MVQENLQPRELWGGAGRIILPATFEDISRFREVPDNQEVWADSRTDTSIIIELVEQQAGMSNTDAARFYFSDLASLNESAASEVAEVAEYPAGSGASPMAECSAVVILRGAQRAKMQGQDAKGNVDLRMAVVRLPHVESDVLLTLHTPENVTRMRITDEEFRAIVASFCIVDWGLFGAG